MRSIYSLCQEAKNMITPTPPHPTPRSPEPGEDMIVWHDVGVQVQEKISQFSNA